MKNIFQRYFIIIIIKNHFFFLSETMFLLFQNHPANLTYSTNKTTVEGNRGN